MPVTAEEWDVVMEKIASHPVVRAKDPHGRREYLTSLLALSFRDLKDELERLGSSP